MPPFFVEQDVGGTGGAPASPSEIPSNPSPFELLFVPMKMHGKVAMVLMMAVPPGNDAGMAEVVAEAARIARDKRRRPLAHG